LHLDALQRFGAIAIQITASENSRTMAFRLPRGEVRNIANNNMASYRLRAPLYLTRAKRD
jgi:hypothetical protein